MMNNGALIEALAIARNHFEFDGEHDKAQAIRDYIETFNTLKEAREFCEQVDRETLVIEEVRA